MGGGLEFGRWKQACVVDMCASKRKLACCIIVHKKEAQTRN